MGGCINMKKKNEVYVVCRCEPLRTLELYLIKYCLFYCVGFTAEKQHCFFHVDVP